MEKDEKSQFTNSYSLCNFVDSVVHGFLRDVVAGQAAFQGALVVATMAASASTGNHDTNLKDSVEAFNGAFRSEDYKQASAFVSRKKKNSGRRWTGFKDKSESWNMS